MSALPTFAEFETQARAAGYTQVLERRWAAGTVVDVHTHDFAVDALVTEGELWLTVGDQTRHLVAGSRFTLAHAEPHAERYGDAGAVYWVARK